MLRTNTKIIIIIMDTHTHTHTEYNVLARLLHNPGYPSYVLQQYHKRAYHKLETSGSGEFLLSGTERRLDQVRKETEPDEPEQRPNCNLFSVATPPDSPRHFAHPTSPLIQSKKEQHHSPEGK